MSSANTSHPPPPRGLLLFTAFIAGFVITGIEIALGRLLAPFFGSTLVVWAAIIASIIAALTIGYVIGGIVIDRYPRLTVPLLSLLGGGIASAALGVVAPSALREVMDGVSFHGADYWLRLSVVLALFALASIALAMVAPSALRLTLADQQHAGHVAGYIYGIGSAGSIAGILMPALWWIPQWGIKETFLILGTLSMLPCIVAVAHRRAPHAVYSIGAALILNGLALLPPSYRSADIPGAEVIFEGETPVQHVRIIERQEPLRRVRWLQVNEAGASQSILVEPGLVTGGIWDWLALSALHVQPDDGRLDVLIIGLAAGIVPRMLHDVMAPALPPLRIVGVEIDPQLTDLGAQYFGLDKNTVEIHATDGRTFLRSTREKFDLIILDAYRSTSIPAHLATVEFFAEVQTKLAPQGLALLNVYTPETRTVLLEKLIATWSAVFTNAQWSVGPVYDGFVSRLLIGGAAPLRFDTPRAAQLPAYWTTEWSIMATRTGNIPISYAAIWTDNHSDIERQTDYAYRNARAPAITLPSHNAANTVP